MTVAPLPEIAILLYDGAQAAAVHGLTDLFAVATRMTRERGGGGALRVSHWRPEGAAMACVFDSEPGAAHRPAILIAPPSLAPLMPAEAMRPLARWMAEAHEQGATLASICAGAFVLAETGLLAGRPATTHWGYAGLLSARFPDIRVDADRLVIDDGDLITAGGVMAWTDLGLVLVERLLGPTVMLDTARFLLVDPPGREQRSYRAFIPRLDHGDAAILKVQHGLQATGAVGAALPAMLAQAGLEERTFLRRFRKATGMTPTEYGQQIRIANARAALELTRRSVGQIAFDVGYEDPSAFRKLFLRLTGLTPGAYRKRFGRAGSGD
ncbi:GlxA family transcriptional regulator [Zavarzinia aquatilis]|uniref:AraC family transcriptional regulator n=1 Tax=Zavarzinia aquatilis TaxID=2211142 RepID=A0A317EEX4_9PROT|nr:helix-turn-helix domain-containing protein [Zavarzinia aquatilis]PWR24670.1 AraC family transcriptional regulator [Zavarzinia aquatilis]